MGAAETYKPGTFARFFKAVPGRLVTRHGTHRATQGRKGEWTSWQAAQTFGGSRPPLTEEQLRAASATPAVCSRSLTARPCNPVELDTEMVTAITHEEAARFGRLYDRNVREESLVEVKEKDYVAWLHECDKRDEEARRKAAEQKRAAEVAAEKEAQLAADLAKARAEKTTPAGAATGRTDKPEVPAP